MNNKQRKLLKRKESSTMKIFRFQFYDFWHASPRSVGFKCDYESEKKSALQGFQV